MVGVISSSTAEAHASPLAAFMQGLKDAGFNEGQNFGVEQRWANNRYDRLPEMAADLVRIRQPRSTRYRRPMPQQSQ